MSVSNSKLNRFSVSISSLPDRVTGQAPTLKGMFDARAEELRVKYNGLIDTILDEYYTKIQVDTAINSKITEIGAGDMSKGIYDQDGREIDIFQYVDEKTGRVLSGDNLTFHAQENAIEKITIIGATNQSGTGTASPTNIRTISPAGNSFTLNGDHMILSVDSQLYKGSTRDTDGNEIHGERYSSFTGSESWEIDASNKNLFKLPVNDVLSVAVCSHFSDATVDNGYLCVSHSAYNNNLSGFKSWLSSQYGAGTPMQVILERSSPLTVIHSATPITHSAGPVSVSSPGVVEVSLKSSLLGKADYDPEQEVKDSGGIPNYVRENALSVYAHSKADTVHTLTGTGENIRFTATADYASGDTIEIGGTTLTIRGNPSWKAGDTVMALLDGTNISFTRGIKIYSTAESVIGKWIDGRPIYQRVITMPFPTVSTDGTPATSTYTIPGAVASINLRGFDSGGVTIPRARSSTLAGNTVAVWMNNAGIVTVETYMVGLNGRTATLIVDYLKSS